ncbi:MAG: Trp biosynthesis-associated membrane protein [Jatrophihabitantaceae bacterium]
MSQGHATDRGQLVRAVLLIALGAAAILFAASRSWLTVQQARLAPFGPRTLQFAGRSLYPALNGLAIVALLVAVLTLISGRWPRRLLGVLLVALALVTGWYGLRAWSTPRPAGVRERISGAQVVRLQLAYHPIWAAVTLAGSVLLLVAGWVLASRAGRWQVDWSARYSAPTEVAKSGDPWRRLDRGEDPTIFDG